MNKNLGQLFEQYAGCEAETITRLTAAGSNRVYYRFTFGDKSIVGVEGTNHETFSTNIFYYREIPA